MDAVTYPNDEVQTLLGERVVPFKPQIDKNVELAKGYGVVWTPGLLWLTEKGDVAHSNIGYFKPDKLQAEILLGCGRAAGAQGDWKGARKRFDEVADRWPQSHAAPAAIYWSGVAGKKATDDAAPLMKAWDLLLDRYPDSAWAMKVSFIRES